jgi:Dolichyl-phosphate-mannose-protein mannosyltransferase
VDNNTAVLERPSTVARTTPAPSVLRSLVTVDRLTLLIVASAAVVLAGVQYQHFLDVHRFLWNDGSHDRNAHYLFALELATDLAHGQFLTFLIDLDTARVWPPLHGVLAAAVLLVGGMDYRLAVLPSVAAFAGTIVIGFLVARRALPRGGTVAGITAALLIAASPSHRAYATDVMLESTGAFLTLVVLYCYLCAVQGRGLSAGRWLGLALTALFLEKYNYWLLAVLALCACASADNWRQVAAAARQALAGFDWRSIVRAELRQPLNYVVAVVLVLAGLIVAHGDKPFVLGRSTVSLFPPHNVVHVAYVIVFVRLVRWWIGTGRELVALLPLRVRQLVYWHAWPVAVWLLLPKRVGNFLWFLGPWNAPPEWKRDTGKGFVDYAGWALNDYHAALWCGVMVAILLATALLFYRRTRPGANVVLWLVLFGTVLSVTHANRKARFLHSWVAAGWVGAGIGLAGLTHGWLTMGRPRLRRCLTVAAPGALALALGPATLEAGASPEGGPHAANASFLDLTDDIPGDLTASHRLAVVTTLAIKPLVQWTYLERFGQLDGLEDLWYGCGRLGEENRQGFLHWVETTDCDTVVVCEALVDPPRGENFPQRCLHEQMHDLMRAQTTFSPVRRRELPQLNALVTVWRR